MSASPENSIFILVACALAKAGACYLAARACGQDNRTALAVGTLMNARGLTELIIINIGLQQGIIVLALFSMLVVMAIVTTLMTSPLFDLVQSWGKKAPLAAKLSE